MQRKIRFIKEKDISVKRFMLWESGGNPNHDELGRFASAAGSAGDSNTEKAAKTASKLQHGGKVSFKDAADARNHFAHSYSRLAAIYPAHAGAISKAMDVLNTHSGQGMQ